MIGRFFKSETQMFIYLDSWKKLVLQIFFQKWGLLLSSAQKVFAKIAITF